MNNCTKHLRLSIILLLFPIFLNGQNDKKYDADLIIENFKKSLNHSRDSISIILDSLEKLYLINPDDKILIFKLNITGNQYLYGSQADSALKYYRRASRVALKIGDSLRYYKILGNIGTAFNRKIKCDSAVIILEKAKQYFIRNSQRDLLAKACLDITQSYQKMFNYKKALENIDLADSLYILEQNHKMRTYLFNSKIILYSNVGLYDEWENFYLEAIRMTKKYNPPILAYLYNSVADFYSRKRLNKDTANKYFNLAKAYAQKYNIGILEETILINQSGLAINTEDFNEAQKLLRPLFESNRLEVKASSLVNMGITFMESNLDSARWYLQKGKETAKACTHFDFMIVAYEKLIKIDSLEGNFKSAFLTHGLMTHLKDSIWNEEVKAKLVALKESHEMKEEKMKNSYLTKQNQLNLELIDNKNHLLYIESGIIILFLIIGSLILVYIKKRRKYREDLEQLNTKLSQSKKFLEASNQELKELNEMKNTLFSIISHDLKGNIGTTNLLLHSMEESVDDLTPERRRTIFRSVIKTSDSVYNLLTNLLKWSRIISNKIAVQKVKTSINKVIDESLEPLQNQIKAKKIILNKNYEDEEIFCDPHMLSAILRNLISNAIKFSFQGGEIDIQFKVEENRYSVSVKDHGMGMEQDLVTQLWNENAKTHRKGTENEPGSGFGMRLIKTILDKLNANIAVESEVNKGSTFTIDIPK